MIQGPREFVGNTPFSGSFDNLSLVDDEQDHGVAADTLDIPFSPGNARTAKPAPHLPLQHFTVCLVESDPGRAQFIMESLSERGHDVSVFARADQALRALGYQRFDVLLIGYVGAAKQPLLHALRKSSLPQMRDVKIIALAFNLNLADDLCRAGADVVVSANTTGDLLHDHMTALLTPEPATAPTGYEAAPPTMPQQRRAQPGYAPPSFAAEKIVLTPSESLPHGTVAKASRTRQNVSAQPPAQTGLGGHAASAPSGHETHAHETPAHDAHAQDAHGTHTHGEASADPTKAPHDPLLGVFQRLKALSDQLHGGEPGAKRPAHGAMPGNEHHEGSEKSAPTFNKFTAGTVAVLVLANMHHIF